MDTIEAQVMAALQGFDIFRRDTVDPGRHFRPPPLRVAILQHHLLKVVLSLRITVTEEGCLLGLAHNVGNAVFVAVDADLISQRVARLKLQSRGKDYKKENEGKSVAVNAFHV